YPRYTPAVAGQRCRRPRVPSPWRRRTATTSHGRCLHVCTPPCAALACTSLRAAAPLARLDAPRHASTSLGACTSVRVPVPHPRRPSPPSTRPCERAASLAREAALSMEGAG